MMAGASGKRARLGRGTRMSVLAQNGRAARASRTPEGVRAALRAELKACRYRLRAYDAAVREARARNDAATGIMKLMLYANEMELSALLTRMLEELPAARGGNE